MPRRESQDEREYRRDRPTRQESETAKEPKAPKPKAPDAQPRSSQESINEPRPMPEPPPGRVLPDSEEFRNLDRQEQIRIERSLGGGPGSRRTNNEISAEARQKDAQAAAAAAAAPQSEGPPAGSPPKPLPEPPPQGDQELPGGGTPPPSSPRAGEAGEKGTRTTQGDVQRPIGSEAQAPISPSATGAAQPKPTGGGYRTDRQRPPPGVATTVDPVTGQAIPMPPQTGPQANFAQGAPGEGPPLNAQGVPMTSMEQTSGLKQQFQQETGETSGIMSGMRASEEQERMRRAQPSPVKGITQGHYERVVKDDYSADFKTDKPMSPKLNKAFKANAEEQLGKFGDYPGKGDPDSPSPPIRPGGRSFNPFVGTFTGESGPNAFKLMGIDLDQLKAEFFTQGGGGQPAPSLGAPPPPPGVK